MTARVRAVAAVAMLAILDALRRKDLYVMAILCALMIAAGRVLAGIASVGWRHEVVVDLATTLEQARRRLPPTVGTLTEMPDGVRLTARAERLDGMAQLLAGLGCSFTIVAPEALRAEVTALAARLMSDAARLGVNI